MPMGMDNFFMSSPMGKVSLADDSCLIVPRKQNDNYQYKKEVLCTYLNHCCYYC